MDSLIAPLQRPPQSKRLPPFAIAQIPTVCHLTNCKGGQEKNNNHGHEASSSATRPDDEDMGRRRLPEHAALYVDGVEPLRRREEDYQREST